MSEGHQENASYVELPSLENLDAFARRVYCCLPFLLVTIVPFFAAFYALIPEASTVPWWVFLVGAGGWWLALLLRFPVILGSKAALKNNSNAQSLLQTITVLISGPAEEAIRIAFIFAFGWSLKVPHIFALGLGWTSLELLFTLVQCLATIQLLRGVQQGDAKAVEAFQVLAAQTGRSDPLSVDPFWGVLERCSAHLIHIAMSLYGAVSPWIFLATAPAHSLLNWGTVSLMPRMGAMAVELLLFTVAAASLCGALAIWDLLPP